MVVTVVTPTMSTLRRKEHENCLKFKDSLGYTAHTQTTSLKETNNKKTKLAWGKCTVRQTAKPPHHIVLSA